MATTKKNGCVLTSEDFQKALTNKQFDKKMIEIYNLCKNRTNCKFDVSGILSKTTLTEKCKLVLVEMLNKYKPNIDRKVKFVINN